MSQVRKNDISLRKWPGGTARLRTSEGTLVATADDEAAMRRCHRSWHPG